MAFKRIILNLLFLSFLIFPFHIAHAFLGEQRTGVFSPQLYTIVETVQGKNKIREYLSATGHVFAVAWSGYSHPDLSVILGSYWSEYSEEMKKHQANHFQRNSVKHTQNVVIEKGGHFRSIRGRAYLPRLIPAGVNINELH